MVLEKPNLTQVPRSRRVSDCNEKWDFREGDVRQAFERVYSPKASYVLFQTAANPEAINTLKRSAGSKSGVDSPTIYKGISEDNYVDKVLSENGLRRLSFNNKLMGIYQKVINELAFEEVGKSNFAQYPLIFTDGVDDENRDPHEILWPRVYIVSGEKSDSLKNIIKNLANGSTFNLLREKEAPDNYELPEISALHHLEIPPIVCLDKELKLDAKTLSEHIDFLAQMRETYRWTGRIS